MEPWRILVVDDDKDLAQQTADVIRLDPGRGDGSTVSVEVETSFEAALDLIVTSRFDLLVLDVRDQGAVDEVEDIDQDVDSEGSDVTDADLGIELFDSLRARRFVPVIFYTGLTNLISQKLVRSPFVQLVSKIDSNSTAALRLAVGSVLSSPFPEMHRGLDSHVETIVREFMSDFVEPNWPLLEAPKRKGDLAHLLIRRLALSLADGGEVLASRLADTSGVELSADHVHPMRFYVMPPVGDYTTGDIVTGPRIDSKAVETTLVAETAENGGHTEGGPDSGSDASWFVVLTPACDLVPTRIKADHVVLVACGLLEETDEYKKWIETRPAEGAEPSKDATKAEKALTLVMRNNRNDRPTDRDFFLPAAWTVPNLVADFQRVSSVPVNDFFKRYKREATLDTPYVDALVETFTRYLGRRGTPDLDTAVSIQYLRV